MTRLVIAGTGAVGVYLLYTALAFGWRGVGPSERQRGRRDHVVEEWLAQAGLAGIRPRDFAAVSVALALAGGLLAFALFGGVLPALVAGAFAGTAPMAAYRGRREDHNQHTDQPRDAPRTPPMPVDL